MNPANNPSNSSSNYGFGHNSFNTNQSFFSSNYPSSSSPSSFQDQSSSNFNNDMSFVGSRDFANPPPTITPSNFSNVLPGTVPPSNTQAPKERRNTGNRPNRLTYEEFVKQKIPAFLYFSKHPDTAELFVRSDVDEFHKLNDAYNKLASGVYFATCFLTFSADNWLRYKSIIYGMTYRTSLLKLLVKFWLIPSAVTGAASGLFIDDMYQPKMESIAKRYNYADYIFRTAYEKGEIPKTFKSTETPQIQTNTNLSGGGFPSFINTNTNNSNSNK